MRRLQLSGFILTVSLTACTGQVLDYNPAADPDRDGRARGAAIDPNRPSSAPDLECDITKYGAVKIDLVAKDFAEQVFPKFTTGDGSCTGCHDPGGGRQFIVEADGKDTFFKARSQGFFADTAGSLLGRMVNADPKVRMPKGGEAWARADLVTLSDIACRVRAYDTQGGTSADESFPPELLMPFNGTKSTDYDNSFVNYVQLKNKVQSIFGDDWKRNGVDKFDANIDLFGGAVLAKGKTEARGASFEFLLAMDTLAADICKQATTNKTGPFAGEEVSAAVADVGGAVSRNFEFESLAVSPATRAATKSTNPAGYFCTNNCRFTFEVDVPAAGDYQMVLRGKADLDTAGVGPEVTGKIGTVEGKVSFTNTSAYEDKTIALKLTTAGKQSVTVLYGNNPTMAGGDRNMYFDAVKIVGPLGAMGTGTERADAAKKRIGALYERLFFRTPNADETDRAYALLTDVAQVTTVADGWTALCEGLVKHPDFLFTLPPSAAEKADAEREKLLLVAAAQTLLGRVPKASEFLTLTTSGFERAIDELLKSTDYRAYFFNRMQLRLESNGNEEVDEASRLWTLLATEGLPFEDLLTADYSVDPAYQKKSRPAEHGKSGVLTMKGYLAGKQGLPHYNYAARVLSGFMGSIFEVPAEAFDQRATSTAASTVDPTSLCFTCHQILTPLSYQRQKWNDDGTYRSKDANGADIDDSDQNLVASYPYKGVGIEAFSVKAVKKELFIRRMINTQFRLLMGREMRHSQEERTLYKSLWDVATSTHDLRAVTKSIALSDTFKRKN